MPTYRVWLAYHDEESDRFEAKDMAAALAQAEELISYGEWGEHEATIWIRGRVDELDAAGATVASKTVVVGLDPEEPDCITGDHDWQSPYEILGGLRENPGVWGHGAGCIIHEVCMHCGAAQITDTWAQDPETGKQGLTSVRYEEGRYREEVSRLRAAEIEACGEECAREAIDAASDPPIDDDGRCLLPRDPARIDLQYLADQLGHEPMPEEELIFAAAYRAIMEDAREAAEARALEMG